MRVLSILLALAVFPAACFATEGAVPETTGAEAAKPAAKKICTREKPVGSNKPVRVCRDAATAERQGDQAREALQQAQTHRFNPPET